MPEEITITIEPSCQEEGYVYSIFNKAKDEIDEDEDEYDGGFCTGTLLDALGMASSQAEDLIKKIKHD